MSAKRRPTMADVAALAGVSLSTVSLTYSGAGPISPHMRARVEKAAAELDYAGPSARAQALRSGRSRVVGLVIHERLHYALRDPFTLRVLDALIGDLGEMGQGVLLLPSPSADSTEPTLLGTAAMDAAVLMRVRDHDEPALEILARRELPFAIVEGTAPGAVPSTMANGSSRRARISSAGSSWSRTRIRTAASIAAVPTGWVRSSLPWGRGAGVRLAPFHRGR